MRIRSTTPLNSRSLPMGSWMGTAVRPKISWTLVERALKIGALAIQLVDDDGAGELELVGEGPDLLGLHFHAGHAVDHDQGGIGGDQGAARVINKDVVTRGVQDIDLGLSSIRPRRWQ